MDDFTDQESEGQEPEADQEVPNVIKALRAEVKALKTERDGLKSQVETALTERYGEEIMGLVPEEVRDFEKRAELAKRLHERLAGATQAQTEQAMKEEPAQVEAPAQDESALAAVGTGPQTGAAAPEALMTVAEIKELGKTDPDTANRLIREGKFVQQNTW